MLRGLFVGMLGGGLVMAALLMALSLLAPLPRVAAPVADERGRTVPLASTPQRAVVPQEPSNIVERPAAPSGAAEVAAPRPSLPLSSGSQTARLDAPRAAEATQPAAQTPPAQTTSVRPQVPTTTGAAPSPAPTAAPSTRETAVAAVPPASSAPRETAPARRIAGASQEVTRAPQALFVPAAPDGQAGNALTAISAVAPTPMPARPGRPRSELRLSNLLTDPGPVPPEEMLVRGPSTAEAGQGTARQPQTDPFASSPLGGSDFVSSLAGSRLLEGTMLDGALAPSQGGIGQDQLAAAPLPAPDVPSQSRDAPMVGSPVLPLTERSGVRPLTERRPTLPLPSVGAGTDQGGPSVVPAWRRNAVAAIRSTGPVLSVMVIDDGISQRERRLFINRALPVTVVVDLEQLNAPRMIAEYKAAGFEVMLLPAEGMTAQEALAAYPGSIGLLMPSLSQRRVEALRASGHAVVLRPGGLDGGLRDFLQTGLPGLRIYRDIDAGRERAPVIARYLTRAGFEAARSNGEVILGRMRADTLDALAGYIASDASASAPVAPVSRLMALEMARLAGEG